VSQKVPTFKLSVTLSNLNRFSQFLHVATLHWEIKNSNFLQIFSRYSADMEENANKLHFECTDEHPSTETSHGQSCGSAACPVDSRLFSSVRALRGLPLPGRLSTMPVSRNFFNTHKLCPAFLRKFVCQPLGCVTLQIQTFYGRPM